MDTQQRSLETYLRSFAWILGLCALLPFDVMAGEPIWPWMGLRDAAFMDGLAILLPLIGALLFFLLSASHFSKLSLSLSVLLALGLAWLVAWWAEQIPHPLPVFGHLTDGLPGLFSRSLWLLLLGSSVLGAGVLLSSRASRHGYASLSPKTWHSPGRLMLLLGISLVVVFYFVDYRGHIPLIDLVMGMVQLLPALHDIQGLALFSGHVLSIGPLLLALASVPSLRHRAHYRSIAFFAFCVGFIPALCLLVGVRDLSITPVAALVHLRSSGLMLTISMGIALGLSAFLRALWFDSPWLSGQMGWIDHLLAGAGFTRDVAVYFEGVFDPMNPLVRLFARRRLALWTMAAKTGSSEEGGDIADVVKFLVQVQNEERALCKKSSLTTLAQSEQEQEKEQEQETEKIVIPWWSRGHWITSLVLCLIGLVVFASLYSVWRPASPIVCHDNKKVQSYDANTADEIFSRLLPEVVVDMEKYGRLRKAAPLFDLENALKDMEPTSPGICVRADSLLMTASRGRYLFHSLRRARDGFNRILLENHIPYYVSSRILPRRNSPDLFYLLSYRISSCSVYRETRSAKEFSVLYLHRVDKLNIMESYMGVAEEEEEFVTVIVDRLSSFMEQQISVVLERQDLIGALVAVSVDQLGDGPGDLQKGPEGALGVQLVQGLTRHELHHRWLGLEPEPPAEMWAFLKEYSNGFARAVTAEVGAFLGELSYLPAYARLRLALMIDALERPVGRRGVYGRARVFILHKILGVDAFLGQKPTPAWLDKAAQSLDSIDDDELMQAVDKAHLDLFGVKVPRFELVKSTFGKAL